MIGLIGYDLIVLGIACIVCKIEWLIPFRKYLMCILLTVGIGLVGLFMWDREPALSIYLGIFASIWFILLLWTTFTRKKLKEEILHIPSDSYEIQVVDRTSSPMIQLSYLLFYQGKVYHLSTLPPDGKPPLILHARIRKDSDVILADIAIDQNGGPLSIGQMLQKIRNLATLLIAFFLPISYIMYENHSISKNIMPFCIMIILGRSMISCTKESKALLHRLLYYFGVFFEASGWIGGSIMAIQGFSN